MNLPIESFIPSGAGLVATIAGLVGMWFKFQSKVERLEEDKTEIKRQIEAVWKWKSDHENTATELREKFNKELAEVRASMLVTNEQFKQILAILSDIKDRIDKLEEK
jgi:DNA repair exonuclease SbcCD nuclease subunit